MTQRLETFPYAKAAQAIRRIDHIAEEEQKQRGRYYFNGSPALSSNLRHKGTYENTFNLLKPFVISRFLEERAAQGRTTIVLDIAGGDGTAVRDLCERDLVDAGVTLTLADIRTFKQQKRDEKISHHVVGGDVMRRRTWNEIDLWLKQNSFSGFDLIMSRPMAGIHESIPRGVYQVILDRALNRLMPSASLMIAETPRIAKKEVQNLRSTLEAQSSQFAIRPYNPSSFYLARV